MKVKFKVKAKISKKDLKVLAEAFSKAERQNFLHDMMENRLRRMAEKNGK